MVNPSRQSVGTRTQTTWQLPRAQSHAHGRPPCACGLMCPDGDGARQPDRVTALPHLISTLPLSLGFAETDPEVWEAQHS